MPTAPSAMNGQRADRVQHEARRERHRRRHAVGHERRAGGELEHADRAGARRHRLRERRRRRAGTARRARAGAGRRPAARTSPRPRARATRRASRAAPRRPAAGRAAPRGPCAASRSATPPRVRRTGRRTSSDARDAPRRARSRARPRAAPTRARIARASSVKRRVTCASGQLRGDGQLEQRDHGEVEDALHADRRQHRRAAQARLAREREHAHELAGAHRQHVVGEQADLRGPERRHRTRARRRAGRARASARSASRPRSPTRRRRPGSRPGWRRPIALRTSWKLRPRIASQPKTTETAMPATAARRAPHALTCPGSGT